MLVNVSSVYVPYSGVGKQAVSQEQEIIEEIKLAVMDCARNLQRYMSGERNRHAQASKYNTIIRYVGQLSMNLSEITGMDRGSIEAQLKSLIEGKYKKLFEADNEADENGEKSEMNVKQEDQNTEEED